VAVYAMRRILLVVPTLFALSVLLFVVIRVLPPDDAIELQLDERARGDAQVKASLMQYFGLHQPLWRQYTDWAGGLLRGDLGISLNSRRPIRDELASRIPVSFELSLIGLFVTWVVSFPLGVLSAVYQDRLPDYLLCTSAYLLDAIPSFVIATLVITYLAVYFTWAPPVKFTYLWDDPIGYLKIMLLPILIIGIGAAGNLVRFTRTFLLEVLRQDYVRSARAKGLSERTVLRRHALRNLALPFVTVIGATIPTLLTSSVIIERLFNLPGMGRYLVTAVSQLDYPVIQSTTMLFAVLILTSQLITDLSYTWLDPRVSYK